MLKFLGAIFSAVFGVLGFAFSILGGIFGSILHASGLAPTVPEADGFEEFAEIDEQMSEVVRDEELVAVRHWASAKLFNRQCDLPAGRVGAWLSALTVDDAGRIAAADGCGMLADHLAGRQLFPMLPPVADFENTRQWRLDRMPVALRHKPRAFAERGLSTEINGIDHDFSLPMPA